MILSKIKNLSSSLNPMMPRRVVRLVSSAIWLMWTVTLPTVSSWSKEERVTWLKSGRIKEATQGLRTACRDISVFMIQDIKLVLSTFASNT